MRLRTLLAACGALSLAAWSCAKLQDTLPSQPALTGVHPQGWADSSDHAHFHGALLLAGLAEGIKLDSCGTCHGQNLRGGTGPSCSKSGCHSEPLRFHPAGPAWIDTASPAFHGAILRANGFQLDTCAACHGRAFDGNPIATRDPALDSLNCARAGCHVAQDGGPIACYNCHGDRARKLSFPPRAPNGSTDTAYYGVGHHAAHMTDTTLSSRVYGQCATCHSVPTDFWQASHITGTRAVITFGDTLAFHQTNVPGGYRRDTARGAIVPAPSYDPATNKCSNVYCHGYFKNGNLTNAPAWTAGGQAVCGSCHGTPGNPLPGGTHPNKTACVNCHDAVVDDHNTIINPSLHIDGKLDYLGDEYDTW